MQQAGDRPNLNRGQLRKPPKVAHDHARSGTPRECQPPAAAVKTGQLWSVLLRARAQRRDEFKRLLLSRRKPSLSLTILLAAKSIQVHATYELAVDETSSSASGFSSAATSRICFARIASVTQQSEHNDVNNLSTYVIDCAKAIPLRSKCSLFRVYSHAL
jgi:hypothetical protein